MGTDKYVVESQFDDLHGNADDNASDLELDLSDSDNPIIKAALSGADDNWTPPEDDDRDDEEGDLDDQDDDEEDDDEEEISESDEDESDDEEEEDEDDEDDEEDSYSKKVQQRIDRERQLRQESERKHRREIAALRRKIDLKDARDEFERDERKAESELRKLRRKRKAAREEGDDDVIDDIDEQILDIKTDIRVKQESLKRQEDKAKDADDTDGDIDERPEVPEAGRKWLQKYPEFHSRQDFKQVVLQADAMVASRGFDKNTDTYYEEIEKIVAVQFPDVIKKKNVKVTKKRRKKPAVGGTGKAGTRTKKRSTRKGVVRLTKADQAQMVQFGLDPKNPTHAKEWAANKTG